MAEPTPVSVGARICRAQPVIVERSVGCRGRLMEPSVGNPVQSSALDCAAQPSSPRQAYSISDDRWSGKFKIRAKYMVEKRFYGSRTTLESCGEHL